MAAENVKMEHMFFVDGVPRWNKWIEPPAFIDKAVKSLLASEESCKVGKVVNMNSGMFGTAVKYRVIGFQSDELSTWLQIQNTGAANIVFEFRIGLTSMPEQSLWRGEPDGQDEQTLSPKKKPASKTGVCKRPASAAAEGRNAKALKPPDASQVL